MSNQINFEPGLIVLFGSGETSPTGRKIFEGIFRALPNSPRLALLETPAGFEPNSPQVIGRIAQFFIHHLQNYSPDVEIVAARKRGTPFSPDDPQIVSPLLTADMIFMGPGSPSYAIRQLRDSLAWNYLLARHHLGGALALASAATVAFSAWALPVYEIYKAGEDLYWLDGLNFFKQYGMDLAFIPHWNNNEGGAELDTSRCFMGEERFNELMKMLPEGVTVIGLDEKTALTMNFARNSCHVRGLGGVTLLLPDHNRSKIDDGIDPAPHKVKGSTNDNKLMNIARQYKRQIHRYPAGQSFSMNEIGPVHTYHPEANLAPEIWQKALQIHNLAKTKDNVLATDDVMQLVNAREAARLSKDWRSADELRQKIELLGWLVVDTNDGPVIKKISTIDKN
jgi:hypothetical protein